ncbi:MAG: hypothetical protein HYX27_16265 [Acidobacteria bacterium]|nr:hypothetical protein [Acidobacteriota bacterium]
MTREQKAEIARRNGAKSRGPKTEAGKAASSRNAIKHGRFASTSLETAATRAVASFEHRELFFQLVRRNIKELVAKTPFERDIAIAIADTQWRYERWNQAETRLLEFEARQAVEYLEERQSEGLDLDMSIEEAYARATRNLSCRSDFTKRATAERTRLMRERAQHLRTMRALRNELNANPKQTKVRTREQTNVLDFPVAVSS